MICLVRFLIGFRIYLIIFVHKFFTLPATNNSSKKKAVAIWLLVGVFMIIIQVVIGGVTRLTGSGLSITEWKPIMGTIPPLNEQDWLAAFAAYQEIAQFKHVNYHYELSDFKFIYYWEWFHRVWARALGVVFAIPFVFFLVRKYFLKDMILPLIILFLLGGLQGFIGWYMVQSGLYGSELLNVSHIRLAIHFIAALGLLVYTLWFALKLLIPKEKLIYHARTKNYFLGLLGVLIIQLIYGAFMAGLHAARIAPTWPKMNGRWIPANLMQNSWVNHAMNIQFVHRGIAYLLIVLIVIGFLKTRKLAHSENSVLLQKTGNYPLILVIVQVLLGIFSLLTVRFIEKGKFGMYETLAELHQIVGMFLLMAVVAVLYMVRGKNKTV